MFLLWCPGVSVCFGLLGVHTLVASSFSSVRLKMRSQCWLTAGLLWRMEGQDEASACVAPQLSPTQLLPHSNLLLPECCKWEATEFQTPTRRFFLPSLASLPQDPETCVNLEAFQASRSPRHVGALGDLIYCHLK